MLITKEQALRVAKRAFKDVRVDELDGELRVAGLDAESGLAFGALQKRAAAGENVTRDSMLLVLEKGVIDEKGDPLFDAESAIAVFRRISLPTMQMLVNQTLELSFPTKAKDGNPEGNSKASPSDG